MRWKRKERNVSRRSKSFCVGHSVKPRRQLLLESLESRRLLAQLELTAVADGEVADTDLDGAFETVSTNGLTISDRWFSSPIGQERGVFEFDLAGIPSGATVTSAKIGLDVASFTSPPNPGLVFRSYAGDGVITLADGDAVSVAAGTGTASGLGYQEFSLDVASIQPHVGGHLGIRMENTALSASWLSVDSLEGFGTDPKLIVDYDPLALTVAVQDNPISESAGANATTALVSRNGDLSQSLAVTLISDDTSEVTVSTSVTIPALAASVQVPLDAADDDQVDGTQSVTITAAATGFVDGTDTVDVTDDDTAGITVAPLSGLVTTEVGGQAQFTLVLDSEPTHDVTIDVESTDPGEGNVSPSTVTFTPSNWDIAKTVTVTGADDPIADGDQAFTIVTGLASSDDAHYGSAADPIVVDDVERGEFRSDGSNIGGTDYMAIGEHVTTGEFRSFLTFDLSGVTVTPVGAALSLQVDAYDSTTAMTLDVYDYVLGNDALLGTSMTSIDAFNDLGTGQLYGSASINSTSNPVGSTFTIPLSAAAVADINSKADGLFTVGFVDAMWTDGVGGQVRLDRSPSLRANQLLLWTDRPGIDPPDVTVTNQDDETPTLSVSVMADSVPENSGIEATTVTITRNTDTSASLVVDLASSDTSAATVPVIATIPAGHSRVTVPLNAIDDAVVDGPQVATISATAPGFTGGADMLTVTDVESDGLGDRVWYDTNGNGIQDVGELGVPGAVVELFESSDAIVGNVDDVSRGIDITDSLGNYQLAGLVDGSSYYLQFRVPSGYTFTTLDAGSDDAADSDADHTGLTSMFVHSLGQPQQSWDAGLVDGPPDFGFAGRVGGPLDDNASVVETDAAGNVFVSGAYRELVDFDLGPGDYPLRSVNTEDVYVAKYTPQGSLVWARGVDGSGTDASHGLAVTDSGDVVVTGSFQNTADFDPGAGTYELTSAGADDIFVWKLDSGGDLVWARAMSGTSNEVGRSVAVMPDGGVVVTGEFAGTVDFDPGAGVNSLVNASGTSYQDVFVTRLDASGDFVWAKRIGGSRFDKGYDVAVGPDGSILTTGNFQSTVDFDPGAGTFSLSTTGSSDYDTFVLKLTESGDFVWAKRWGGSGVEIGNAVAVGADGAVYTAGVFSNTVDFDPGPGTFDVSVEGSRDAFASKLNSNGEFVWAKSWGGSGFLLLDDMSLAADESLYLTGSFPGTVDFDPGPDMLPRTSAGSNDVFVNVLDRDGDFKWAQTLGGVGDDQGLGVAVAGDRGAYLGGLFADTTDFDPRDGLFELNPFAGEDLFVARLAPPRAPTAVQLFEDRVLEDQPVDTPIGALAGVDPDPGETFTFRLVTGAGDADNDSFRVDNGSLWTWEVFDHDVKNSYSIRVRATDASGMSFEQPLTINVLPIAQAASIGNFVWQDVNQDGLQDFGEDGVAGAVVEVYSVADGVLRGSAVTDAGGTYAVDGLLPGLTYNAKIRPPVGYSFTVADAGSDDTIDSDAGALGNTPSVTVSAGEVVDTLDVGLIGSQPSFGFASTIATTADDRAQAIATDAEGNVYLAGVFRNTADFDPGPGVFEMTGQGSGEIFVAKYSSTGAFHWAKSMGGTSFDQATSVMVAADGSVVVAGSFQGSADFDPGSGEYFLSSKGSTDAFVAKLDSTGNLQWAHSLGSTSFDVANGVAGAADGSVYVTGYFRNTVDFDPGPGTFSLSASNNDAFVWKLDSQGEFDWATRLGGTSSDLGYAIAVAPSGNVVATGSFQGTADMDPGAGVSNMTSAGSADAFVTVLDENGAFVWARRFGGTGLDQSYAVSVATDGSVLTGGKFSNTVDFDPGAGTYDRTSVGGYDAFVSKLDSSGNFVWTTAWGGNSSDETQAISVSPDGSVQATGSFYNTIDFDPGAGVVERTAVGASDVFVSLLSAAGDLQWAQSFGGTSADVGYGVVAGADGSVYATGKVVGTVDFDARGGEYSIAGGGGQDVFLTRLLPPQSPSGLSLAQDRVLEQQPVNTIVGDLVTANPPGESFVFELVSGTGDQDNGSFAISGGAVVTQAVLDHSVQQSYSIRVRATDSLGLSFEQPLTITTVDLSQAGSIGNRVWHDQNGNGIQDVGETGVEGVGVEAFSSADGFSRGSTVTDANGNYTISGLLPDLDYEVQFRPPVGFDFTGADVGGDDSLDSDAGATGRTAAINVTAGAALVDVDAGLTGAEPWFGFAFGAGAVSETSLEDQGRSVVVDDNGNIYVTGTFQDTVDFDPGPGTFELTSQGSIDTFVAKYSAGGSLEWATSFGGPNGVLGTAIALAPGGDLLVAGEFSGSAKFRAGFGSVELTGAGGFDGYVTRIAPNGELIWAKAFGGTSNERMTGVAAAPGGSVVMTGYFSGTADFDPGIATNNLTSAGVDDAFVLKLDAAGDYQWARQFGSSSYDRGYGVAVAADGSIYTVGQFRYTVDFDPGAGVQSLASQSNGYDAFVSKLDASGNYVWAQKYGGTGTDYGYAVAVGSDGSVHTAGSFANVVDFDPGAGVHELTSAGSTDGFIVKTDSLGDFLWAWQLGGANAELADGIAIGPGDGVYATGYSTGGFISDQVDFDPGPSTFVLPDVDVGRDYAVHLDAAGEFQWARRVPAAREVTETGIAVDSSGSIVLTSSFANTGDFSPGSGSYPVTANSFRDVYVWKLAPPVDPTAIFLPDNRVMEQQPPGTVVGPLSASDADPDDAFTFALVAGSGDDDNADFQITDGVLLTAATFVHATQSTYSIRVRATDSAGRSVEQSVAIQVQNLLTAASVGDRVWNDLNANGIQDAGEPGVVGAVAEIFSADDDRSHGVATTDASGNYTFDGLLPAKSYYVQFRAPAGFEFTATNVGSDDQVDTDADSLGKTAAFTTVTGGNLNRWDAGLIGSAPAFGFALSAGDVNVDSANAIALDDDGNAYITGTFRGTIDLDPGPAVMEFTSSGNSQDGFVAKYTSAGTLVWAAQLDGASSVYGHGIHVSSDGHVHVTGAYGGNLKYRLGGAVTTLDGAGTQDIFVTKLDEDGNLLWLKGFVGGRGSGQKIVTGDDGSVYTVGSIDDTIDFDPGIGVFELSYQPSYDDLFISKLDASGDFVWAKLIAGGQVGVTGLRMTPDGNMYLGGSFRGGVDFDPGVGVFQMSSTLSYRDDAYIAKLDGDGNFLWARKTTGTGNDTGRGLAVAADGGVIGTGAFEYSPDFDPGPGTFTLNSAGGSSDDGFLWKLDASGDFVWAKQIASVGFVYGQDVEVANDGSIYLMGLFPASVDVDPGPGTFELTTTGGYDTFVAKFDSAANLQSVQTFGSNATDDIALMPDGSVFSAGTVAETNSDFDPRGNQYLLNATSSDIFVALHRSPSAPTAITLPANRVFEFQPIGTVVGGLVGIDADAGELFDFTLVSGAGDADNASFTIDDGLLTTATEFDAAVKDTYSIRVEATDLSGLKVQSQLTVSVVSVSDVATITGQLWIDINADGIRQDDEPPVSGAVAQLRTTADQLVRDSVVIEAEGHYTFSGVVPGVDHVVEFRVPVGYDYTVAGAGVDDTVDSDVNALGVTHAVIPTAGQTISGLDAGLVGTPPNFGFVLGFGGSSDDEGRAVATDSEGNVYVAGTFDGFVDFDPGPGKSTLSNEGANDVFLAKYTRLGALVWAKQFEGGTFLDARALVVSADGSVVLAGNFNGEVDFDPGPAQNLISTTGNLTYVVRLDAEGELVWAKSLSGAFREFAEDADGNLLLTGNFSGTTDFDPGPGTYDLTAAGGTDGYVLKLDHAGDFVWARGFGGSSSENAERIASDSLGRVYVNGTFPAAADFDPGPYANTLTPGGAFLLRLSSNGDFDWAGRVGHQYGRALTVSDDAVYGSGLSAALGDYDPGSGVFELQTYGSYDIPVYRLDFDGNLDWAVHLGGTMWDQAYGLANDPNGNLVGVGSFEDVADFDPGATDILLTSAGEADVVVFRLGAAGTGLEAYRFGGVGDDLAYGVDIGPDGSIYSTGYFADTATLDAGLGASDLTSNGGRDTFLLKLTANESPVGLALSNSTALATSPPGTLVGFFSTTDPNPDDRFVYTLVSGSGDTDNGAFRLDGRKLKTTATFGGKSSYDIRVRSTDRDGQWFESTFVITNAATVDIPPEVDSIVRADANPTIANSVNYTVTFNEPVTGVTVDDFALVENGVTGAAVTNVAGSGTIYTVTVSSVSGDGTLRMDLIDDDTILDLASQPLGGVGAGNGSFILGDSYTFDLTPPEVESIVRLGANPTSASNVDFVVTFSEAVSGVDASDFDLVTTGITGVSIANITNQGPVYIVTVNSGTGDGTLRLDVTDDDSITDIVGNSLGGPGVGSGNFGDGQVYAFDRSPPTVLSIVRADDNPTDAAAVTFTVTFSESVTDVDVSDFALTLSGLPGATVIDVIGSGDTRSVIASTGLGDGTVRLDVADNDSILDAYGNRLGGTGVGNGDFTLGDAYTIQRTGEIYGRKWDDVDGDGYWDPAEPGLAGVTMFLDLNNNYAWDVGEPTAITEADDLGTPGVDETGQYRFENLGPGTYSVAEITPLGWEQTYPITRTSATGQLNLVESLQDGVGGIDGLDEAAGVAVSPDGNHIYVASYSDDSVTVFQRDPKTGQATLLQVARNNIGGVTGLNGAQSVMVSPDGKHVYVSSDFDDSLVAFSRDPLTGLVTFVERETDGAGGVDGLDGALSVAISPDGAHVYATGAYDDAIAVFERDSNTGQLNYVQTVKDGVGGVDGLAGVFSVVISPDGAHAYAGGTTDDAVAIFSRNPSTGLLTYLDREEDGEGGVNGLNGAAGVALSPDGNHVYVAGHQDDRIAVFTRNATSGALSYVQSIYSATTLNGVLSLSLSPDGLHLYSASEIADTVNVYSRNSVSGVLTFVESFQDGVGGVDGLDWAWYTTVSPDGQNVYAAGALDDTLVTFSRDGGTVQPNPHTVSISSGEVAGPYDFANANTAAVVTGITRLDSTPTAASSVQFAVTFSEIVTGFDSGDLGFGPGAPTGAAITNFSGSGSSYTVTVDTGTGTGTLRLDVIDNDSVKDDGDRPLGGVGLGNGDYIDGETYVIDRTPPSAISILASDPNPTDKSEVDFTVTFNESVTGVGTGDFSLVATGSITGESILNVTGSGDTYVVTVSAGSGDGTLRLDLDDDDSIVDQMSYPLGGNGASNGNRTGDQTYTILPDTAEIRGFLWSDLDNDGVADAGEPGVPGVTIFLDFDGNGQHDLGEPSTVTLADDPLTTGTNEAGMYALTGLQSGTYDVLQIVPAQYTQTTPQPFGYGTGELTYSQITSDAGLTAAFAVTVSQDGTNVYVVSTAGTTSQVTDGAIVAYSRDPATGHVTKINAVYESTADYGLGGAQSVTLSPDGEYVYVAGTFDDAVSVLRRDQTTGAVSHVQTMRAGTDLDYVKSIAISHDGAYLYAVGTDYVTTLARNAATGMLSHVQTLRDDVGGIDGLDNADSIIISPDGAHAYTVSYFDDALVAFERNVATGELSLIEIEWNDQNGVSGLGLAYDVAISSDGKHVYTVSRTGGLAVFSRDAVTGQVTFVDVIQEGVDVIDVLAGAHDVEVAQDGAHVYVASYIDNTISTFSRDPNTGLLSLVQVHTDGAAGVDGLQSVWGVAVSPDGGHVYTASYDDDLVVFQRDAEIRRQHRVTVTQAQVVGSIDFGNFRAVDFGDAPRAAQSGFANSYPVRWTEDGARHSDSGTGPILGSAFDAEFDGAHSTFADADDLAGTSGDEDGVFFGGIVAGSMAGINIHMQNAASAKVDAWIDFNQDGVWDVSEKILNSTVVSPGLQTLNYTVPSGATSGVTYARVRISTAGGLNPTGAAVDGEVEDYAVTIGAVAGTTAATVNNSHSSRSELTSIEVQFDAIVEALPSDFILENTTTGQLVTGFSVSLDDSGGSTLATLTFSGGESVIPASESGMLPTLANGNYELRYRPATLDGSSGPIAIDQFFRKYGDANANNVVDLLDFAAFRQAFGKSYDAEDPNNGFDSGLDADRDGTIGLLDFAAFRSGFGN